MSRNGVRSQEISIWILLDLKWNWNFTCSLFWKLKEVVYLCACFFLIFGFPLFLAFELYFTCYLTSNHQGKIYLTQCPCFTANKYAVLRIHLCPLCLEKNKSTKKKKVGRERKKIGGGFAKSLWWIVWLAGRKAASRYIAWNCRQGMLR